jgi:hypothetical protein
VALCSLLGLGCWLLAVGLRWLLSCVGCWLAKAEFGGEGEGIGNKEARLMAVSWLVAWFEVL